MASGTWGPFKFFMAFTTAAVLRRNTYVGTESEIGFGAGTAIYPNTLFFKLKA